MKRLSKLRYTLLGMLIMAIFCTSVIPSLAAQTIKKLDAYYKNIRIEIDRQQITPKDVSGTVVEPFIVDGTTYVPIRAIAEALNKVVEWDGEKHIVNVYSKSESVTKDEVGRAFTEVYLSVDTLQDSTVDSVEQYGTNTWLVKYSVLPKAGHNEWMAGNGENGSNGWIVNKTHYVYVVKTDGVVNLKLIGTGL